MTFGPTAAEADAAVAAGGTASPLGTQLDDRELRFTTDLRDVYGRC